MFKLFSLTFMCLNMLSLDILPEKNIDFNSWRFIKDQVMGGKSEGFMTLNESVNESFDFISATGNVSTDGGGFLIFRTKIEQKDLSNISKIKFKAKGNNEKYFIHIKTKRSIFPWVRYLAEFQVSEEWKDFEIEFKDFIRYSNKAPKRRKLNPNKINSIGVEASGRDFNMAIDIASIKLI